MSETKNNRTELMQARMTPDEYQRIYAKFSRSTFRKLSDYIRYALLEKPIMMNQRNQSLDDFMREMERLRADLNAVGNNYNQTVKRLHTLTNFPEIKTWLLLNESSKQLLLEKVSEIKSKIAQINDQWLQS